MALRRTRFLCAATLMALLAAPQLAAAEMLDEPACNALKNEQARLAAAGLKTEMLHGPDWAKANLPASRLEEIKHLIEVEEQIAFRCPLPPPPKPPAPAAGTPAATDAAAKGEDAAAKPAKKKKKPKPDDAAAADQAAPAETIDQPPPRPQKKKRPVKKKDDVNDAYVPPPASGNALVDGEAEPVPQRPPAPKLAP
jgi:hypothetical protein